MTDRTYVALLRLGRVLLFSVLAALGTWLVGPGPGDLFGPSEAVFVVPVLSAVLLAIDKYFRFDPSGPVV